MLTKDLRVASLPEIDKLTRMLEGIVLTPHSLYNRVGEGENTSLVKPRIVTQKEYQG